MGATTNAEIQSSTLETETAAKKIKSIADQFDLELKNTDGVTTILANGKSKDAFYKAANTMETFCEQLAVEANNIKTIGSEFEALDQICSDMNSNIGK